jgi:hypothetical protein
MFVALMTFGTFVTLRTIITGSGTPNGQGFRREEQPVIFWSIVGAEIFGVGLIGYFWLAGFP